MKGVLFFLGSLIQWPIRKPTQFLVLHIYIAFVRFIASNAESLAILNTRSIFSLGVLIPVCFAINQGIPLDVLDYKAAIDRENSFRSETELLN